MTSIVVLETEYAAVAARRTRLAEALMGAKALQALLETELLLEDRRGDALRAAIATLTTPPSVMPIQVAPAPPESPALEVARSGSEPTPATAPAPRAAGPPRPDDKEGSARPPQALSDAAQRVRTALATNGKLSTGQLREQTELSQHVLKRTLHHLRDTHQIRSEGVTNAQRWSLR